MQEIIRSKDNQKIKTLRKLKQKKFRVKTGQFLIEGQHLIDEALSCHQTIETVIIAENYTGKTTYPSQTITVSEPVMATLSSLETPPGIMAVIQYVPKESKNERVLMLENIQDPGNMGTLIRSAAAFNFDTIYVSENSVDVFSDKVLRSTQGALFHVNVETANLLDVVKSFEGRVYVTALQDATFIDSVKTIEESVAVVLGNEGSGVSDELLSVVENRLKIEMVPNIESLNVAIAGSIIMHHFKRE